MLLADAVVSCANLETLTRPRLKERLTVERRRGRGFSISIYRPLDWRKNPDLLYYFHGAGQSDRSWPHWSFARDFYAACRRQGLVPPTVVSISFGHLWLLTEDGQTRGRGLLRRFLEEALPEAERAAGAPRFRFAWGMSMGGFNLMELLVRRPELWHAAALSSPAIPTLGPLSAEGELADYLGRTRAGRWRIRWMFDFVRPHFPDAEQWRLHDPLALASRARVLPPILIEVGDKDEWGFFEGAERLHAALVKRGADVVFRLRAGGAHCDIDSDAVAAFFAAHAHEATLAEQWTARWSRARARAADAIDGALSKLTFRTAQSDSASIGAPESNR